MALRIAQLNGNSALVALLEELIKETKKNGARLEELLDHVAAPKRVVKDKDGEVVGVELADDD